MSSINKSANIRLPLEKTVTFLKDSGLFLLPAEEEGGFAVLPKGEYLTKAQEAIGSSFDKCSNVCLNKSDLRALIRNIIREELQKQEQRQSTAASTPSPPFDLRSLVKQELAAITSPTAPVAPPARRIPTYAAMAAMTTPTP
ncbi:hypothetical protein HPB52_008763 [Rhipicephalus sanguineus]|uniref:Uncharacterized protein n=1 Tax=Rhipicephalus sanguineus TaxID=34632 RepID=A0A9D4PVE6_RHISA|nr:hypothetical protein HPB52_008763 [Rhipicephalus sanguineus]